MEDSADLDGVGIVADEEEPIITNPQPKFFSSLESFHVARSGFRETMQCRKDLHGGRLA